MPKQSKLHPQTSRFCKSFDFIIEGVPSVQAPSSKFRISQGSNFNAPSVEAPSSDLQVFQSPARMRSATSVLEPNLGVQTVARSVQGSISTGEIIARSYDVTPK